MEAVFSEPASRIILKYFSKKGAMLKPVMAAIVCRIF
jgi:hypothetical protein